MTPFSRADWYRIYCVSRGMPAEEADLTPEEERLPAPSTPAWEARPGGDGDERPPTLNRRNAYT